jgi:hypothetical protein
MKINNWRIFNKIGSPLNWFADPYLNLNFSSNSGFNAEGYIITDTSGYVSAVEVTNGGYGYDTTTQLSYTYLYSDGTPVDITSDVSINYIDVSIFDHIAPNGRNVKSINDVSIYSSILSTQFIYPSTVYTGAIFLKPVSVGLSETEHLFILEQSGENFIRPYDNVNSTLVVEMYGDEDQIGLFSINEEEQLVIWTNQLIFNTDVLQSNSPLTINIGFKSDVEGVFERKLRFFHVIDNIYYLVGEIVVNAEAIGEDERFRTLLGNFGLPDPKDFPKLFKETDINEDLPDWEVVNQKSKHMILEHDKIMPYVGTYKALVNAIKWLGYDDIFIREWFLNVKDNKKLSLLIPYDTKDRAQTILQFSPDQRKTLKKLNQLSLNYCLTRETGEYDEWGTPTTENCYEYNIQEVLIKLQSLKEWLEQNIIGVNCRITDLTGEGVYYERFRNIIYTTNNVGHTYNVQQSLTPKSVDSRSELVYGEASINLSMLELEQTTIGDLTCKFKDTITYLYEVSSGITYSPEDPSIISYYENDSSILKIGPPISFPLPKLSELLWKISVNKSAGAVDNRFVTNPLFVKDNTLRFLNILDTSSLFFDSSTKLSIFIERGYIRDPSIDNWIDSSIYAIYPDSCIGYKLESSIGASYYFDDFITLLPTSNNFLQYAVDSTYKCPLLSFSNFLTKDSSNTVITFNKPYYLDILSGYISMIDNTNNEQYAIKFTYDTSTLEQTISLDVEYKSNRVPFFVIDPSWYYALDPSGLAGSMDASILVVDNRITTMNVNHIGDYNLEIFGYDSYNTPFYNLSKDLHKVWIKAPSLYTLIDSSTNDGIDSSSHISIANVDLIVFDNLKPVFERMYDIPGISIENDTNNNVYVKIPTITYFQQSPSTGDIVKFNNRSESVIYVKDSSLIIDSNFQTFNTGDNVNLIKFSKENYEFISEASSYIKTANGNNLSMDRMPLDYIANSSTNIFILNDTYRTVLNVSNIADFLNIDVSGYTFLTNQLVGIIITDACTSYSYGATYKVASVDGSTHTLYGNLPNNFINDSSRFSIKAKHAFSSFADISGDTSLCKTTDSEFQLYLQDINSVKGYLDNTFTASPLLFDTDLVNSQWYDSSSNLVNSDFYYFKDMVSVDISTLVIIRSLYDSSTYMLNQKNIWSVYDNDTRKLVFRVYNDSIPYVFNETNNYNIEVESYDSYGNLIKTT